MHVYGLLYTRYKAALYRRLYAAQIYAGLCMRTHLVAYGGSNRPNSVNAFNKPTSLLCPHNYQAVAPPLNDAPQEKWARSSERACHLGLTFTKKSYSFITALLMHPLPELF